MGQSLSLSNQHAEMQAGLRNPNSLSCRTDAPQPCPSPRRRTSNLHTDTLQNSKPLVKKRTLFPNHVTEFNSLNFAAIKIAVKLRFAGPVTPVFRYPYFWHQTPNNTISFIWVLVHWPDFSSKSTGIKKYSQGYWIYTVLDGIYNVKVKLNTNLDNKSEYYLQSV